MRNLNVSAGLFPGGRILHADLGDQMQSILLLNNLAMAGGLLFVTGAGVGPLALQRAV